jgi:hypothetical protein
LGTSDASNRFRRNSQVLIAIGAIPLPKVGPATRTEDAATGVVQENLVAVAIAERDEFATARQEGDC